MSKQRSNRSRTSHRRPILEKLDSRQLLAIDIMPVANLNEADPWSEIREMLTVGDRTVFTTVELGSTRTSLWRTDGTTPGTIKLADSVPINDSSMLTQVHDQVFFKGYAPSTGVELWKTDGTRAGTSLVRDLSGGSRSSNLSNLLNHNGILYYQAEGHLMRSDGTLQGTYRLADLIPNASDGVSNLAVSGGSIYFTARHGESSQGLYRTNGTRIGTGLVASFASVNTPRNLTDVSGLLFFASGNQELWKANGTNAQLVKSLANGGGYPNEMINVGGMLYFSSNGEIWKSDGTDSGTTSVARVGDGAMNLHNHQGTLFFSGGVRFFGDGYELWKSDGTAAGTVQVRNIAEGFNEGYGDSSYPGSFQSVGNKLFMIANGGIWTSDGTKDGTIPFQSGFHTSFEANDEGVMFAQRLRTPGQGVELWSSNIDGANPAKIERDGPGVADSNPSTPVELNGTIYFSAFDGVHGTELFKLQNGNVTLVKDINPGPESSFIQQLSSVGGLLYFTAFSPATGPGLWRSDGTREGTQFLARVTMRYDLQGDWFTQVEDEVFFSGLDATGWELWKSNGTVAGTARVLDIYPGQTYSYGYGFFQNSSSPTGLVNHNGTLYFSANTSASGRELWKSDGTAAGTTVAVDLWPGSYAYYPYTANSGAVVEVAHFKGSLFFAGYDDSGRRQLWKSDGTLAGTVSIQPTGLANLDALAFQVIGDSMFFVGSTQSQGAELWVTDGTKQGTRLVRDIRVGGLSSSIRQMTTIQNKLYFVANNGVHGDELWESDGTLSGTRIVRDIKTGIDLSTNLPFSSNPTHLTNVGGVLYFSAEDNSRGRELWRTNGTAPGATFVRDLNPGAASANVSNLAYLGDKLYFAAKNEIGNELRSASSQPVSISLANTVSTYQESSPPIRVATLATVTGADVPTFLGGEIRASLGASGRSGDELSLITSSWLSFQGELVLFRDIVIGTVRGGRQGAPLSVELNQNAGPAAVQEVLRCIAFHSTSDNPSTLRRTVTIQVFDGEGFAPTSRNVRVDVVRVNDAPILADAAANPTYQLNASNPVLISRFATVRDPDSSNLDSGVLQINVTGGEQASNQLLLVGTTFAFDADLLTYNGTTIGTRNPNGGTGATPLRITFINTATPAIVQQLLRSIGFRTVDGTSKATRSLSIMLTDGDGGTSNTLSRTITVT